MKVRLRSAGFSARDFDAMLRFYRDELGLPVTSLTTGKGDRKLCEFDTGEFTFYLMWQPKNAAKPAGGSTGRIDLHVDDIEGLYERLTGRGFSCKGPPHQTRFGVKGFSMKDPEGNTVHLIAHA
jgi:catechol 2,3-dioxygenase-like lactoylglutathione lyase family enzyme